ncbi:MAG: hypothetical protein ACRBBP_07650 [Bdellovibrionales bacterium]
MKFISLLFVLLCSISAGAETKDFLGDFEVFPLSTSNIALVEGVWRGEMIDIRIEDSGHLFYQKPILWVEIMDHQKDESKKGIMYFSASVGKYKLYMHEADKSIPIELGIFEFSGSYASKLGMECKSGGTLMKIQFKIDSVLGEVLLTKESCS